MQRRQVLRASGAFLVSTAAAHAGADTGGTGSYDVTVGIEPATQGGDFLCKVAFQTAETGRLHEGQHTLKRGTTSTFTTGEGRPDGSAVDLTVDVTVGGSGERAQFVATITDHDRVISVQR